MNVLFMTIKPPLPANDGGNIASLNMIRAYERRGHKVSLLTMATQKHSFNNDAWVNPICKLTELWVIQNHAKIEALGALKNLFFSNLPYNADRFIIKSFEEKIVEILQNQTYDVIQLEGLYLMPYIEKIRKYSSAKVVLRSHNVEFEIWDRKILEAPFFKRQYISLISRRMKRFEKSYINRYDLLLSITNRDLNCYSELGNSKPSVTIPFGFELPKKQTLLSKKGDICYIGALDWSPNQQGVLWFLNNCWTRILNEKPDIKLSIAGRNAPQQFIDQISKFSNINYLGEVNDAHQYITEHKLMISPLFSGSGMRVKMIEGMALGMPIVATPVAVEGIAAENNIHFVVRESADEFANKVTQLLDDSDEREYLSNQAQQCAHEKYDLESVCKPLWKLLESEK